MPRVRSKRSWHRVASAATAVFMTVGVIGASGVAGATTAKDVGNASAGSAVNTAKSQKLVGPKGTGLTRGISSSQIKVGCVDTAADYAGYEQAIGAAFSAINAKGGVNGRKFSLVPCLDDANSPQTNLTDAQQLVNQNQVFSVLTLSANTLPSTTTFLNNNQTPTFGWGFDPGFCGNKWVFGFTGCLAPGTLPTSNAFHNSFSSSIVTPMAKLMAPLTGKQISFCLQSDTLPASISANHQEATMISALGYKVGLNANNFPTSSTGVNPTPFVQAIINSGCNITYLSLPFASIATLSYSLKAAGYKGKIMDFTTYVPGLLGSSAALAGALAGEYIDVSTGPTQEAGGAYANSEVAALKAAGQPAFLTLGGMIGYSEAQMLIQFVKGAGKTLNTTTFLSAASGKVVSYSNQPGHGPGLINWPAGHFVSSDGSSIVQVEGTKYVPRDSYAQYPTYVFGK